MTYGNQEFRDIPSENPQDIGDTAKKSLKDEILEAFRITDEVAEERKFKFVDQTKKNDKNEPIEKATADDLNREVTEWKSPSWDPR